MSAGVGGAARARNLLARPQAWMEARAETYLVRLGATRSARVALTLDETAFRELIADPGLIARPGGGWRARAATESEGPPPGRPGWIGGDRLVTEADGTQRTRRANLGESPIAWLARRKDQSGRPWLTPAEAAAGERLRLDAEQAAAGPSLTMRWDALPRSGGGSAVRAEPGDRALSAAARVEAALVAVGPRLRPFMTQICIRGSSLQLAEQDFGLRRRQGRTLLKQGLAALAEHYGIG